jgi:outer membrane receptor protein involved in Fe transport
MSFSVAGVVLDGTNNSPLEFATVTVRSLRDSATVTGTITGKDGKFKVEELRPGGHSVEIDFLGYQKFRDTIQFKPGSGISAIDLGIIRLSPSAKLLEAAEITADKSFMMNNIDRKTFNTDQLSVTTGGNVNDVLQQIPSVEVDNEGTVSLRGSENVTILIDGKPSGLTGAGGAALLESIPASSVEKVEVITNPSAKYDPDGVGGILNIVTKKNKLEGLTGVAEVTSSFDNGYGGNLLLSYKTGKWNLSTQYAYNTRSRDREALTYSETFRNDVVNIYDQKGGSSSDQGGHNIRFNAEYNLSDKTTMSAGSSIYTGDRDEEEINIFKYADDAGAIDSLYDRTTLGAEENFNLDLDLSLVHNFSQDGQKLIVLMTSSFNDELSELQYDQVPYYDPDNQYPEDEWLFERDRTDQNNKIYTFSADYEHPFGEAKKLEAGVKSTVRDLDNDYLFERLDNADQIYYNVPTRTNRFVYFDIVNAVYAQWRQSLGRFGYQVGIRAEQANLESELICDTCSVFKNDYFNVYPSAYVTWQLNETTQLKASYSKRINRPSTRQLNPFTDFEDPLNLRQGNPYLEPEYANSFEAEVSKYIGKMSVSIAAYYRYTYDRIQRYKYFKEDEPGVSVLTYQNIDNAKFYGLDWSVNGSPKKWWNLTLSGSTYRNDIDASNISSSLTSSGFAWSARIFSTFKLPEKFEFQLSYYYRGSYVVPQGELQPMQFLNLSLSKRVLKERGTVTAQWNDPFNLAEFAIDVKDQNFTQDIYRKWESRIFTLAFKYRFGELKERQGRMGGRGGSGGNDMDTDF